MNAGDLTLLLCTNGSQTTQPALEYGVWLAKLLHLPVRLLGLLESPEHKQQINAWLDVIVLKLKEEGIDFGISIETGAAEQLIAAQTAAGNYFTVVGPFGRPAWQRVIKGRSIRRILENVETPIFYVRASRMKMERILVCTGGLDLAAGVERLCYYLARHSGACITLLHVIEPVTLQYPLAQQVYAHRKGLIDSDTPQGRNLRMAMQEGRAAGLEVEYKIRQGNVIHEIVEEARAGDYDLVGMGSHYSAHSLRHLYLPNVSAEVAEALACPIVIVRQGHELIRSW